MIVPDDELDRFVQSVKDGDLKTAAHERAFRLLRKLPAEGPLPPWVTTPEPVPPLLDSDGDIDLGRK